MNHATRFSAFAFLSFFLCFELTGCNKTSQSPDAASAVPATLHVPFVPQIGYNWCWAACTEMVSRYYHEKIDTNAPPIFQCAYANAVNAGMGYPSLDCDTLRPGNVPDLFDQTATPFSNVGDSNCEGYLINYTAGSNSPLSWDSLKMFIAEKQPVIFTWEWQGITFRTIDSMESHYMVAEGIPHSSYIRDPGWVSVHDPWPAGIGKHRVMAYSEYANHIPTSSPGSNTVVYCMHGIDYFNVRYQGK